MTDKQLQTILAVLDEIKATNEQIAENTKPAGRARRFLEIAGLIASIGGLFSVADQIIQWVLMSQG